jgi:hypothetical protein
MDLNAFFGVVSTVDFALLGLWVVAVQARPDLRNRDSGTDRMTYLVSLQFTVPGTAALLAQIDPQATFVWRIAFALAGLSGVLALASMVPALAAAGSRTATRFLRFGALPIYALIAVIAFIPSPRPGTSTFSALQAEGVLFCLMAFLGAQIAWAVAMTPEIRNNRAEQHRGRWGDNSGQ